MEAFLRANAPTAAAPYAGSLQADGGVLSSAVMSSDREEPLAPAVGTEPGAPRLLLPRLVLAAWALAFAAALAFFGRVLVMYVQGPEGGLGPCGPMGVTAAFYPLVVIGPWGILAFLWYRAARRTSRGAR